MEKDSSQSFSSFSSESKKTNYEASIEFSVSIKKDQKVQLPNSMDLSHVHGVLFPDNNYFSPLPMPKEWIEIIEIFNKERMRQQEKSNKDLLNFKKVSPDKQE